MTYWLGFFFFIIAGLFFGLFGSGGSIIIIPVLVYIYDMPVQEATTYSLFLVFLIASLGTVVHIKKGNSPFKKNLYFIISAIIFTVFSRLYLLPSIPDKIIIFNYIMSKQNLLMTVFSVVLFFSAVSMFKKRVFTTNYDFSFILFLIGALVGTLTGLLGVGGGFIIIPSLMIFSGINLKEAAFSSLFIISINTLTAMFIDFSVLGVSLDLAFLFPILIFASFGVFIGFYLLNKINLDSVRKMFSIILLLLSLYVFLIEFF